MRALLTRKPPYSVSDLNTYSTDLANYHKLRERSLQLSIVESSNVKQQQALEEVDRYADIIECMQRTVQYMLEMNEDYNKRRRK